MRILIADDDDDIRRYARRALEAAGYEVLAAASGEEALAQLQRFDPALLLTDVRMQGLDGLGLMVEARRLRPDLPVVMMTSFASIDSAVEAMRLGASDYLTKPLNADGLALRVAAVLRLCSLESENRWLRRELAGAFRPESIVAVSRAMRRVVEVIEKLASSEASVLLTGESGTGKDLLARALHFRGPRAEGPFVALNCAALPSGLVESELFGHAKGAFTGAVAEHPGKLEQAHTGTLFLDEVGELPLETQPKLLRALETRLFERVGDTRTRRVDVRLVSATNRDLRGLVRRGLFREDLYFRLAVVPVAVPALRERPEDVGPLARYFMARVGGADAPELGEDALAALERRPWPGNARELANLIECTLALHEGGPIRAADLRSEVSAPSAAPEPPGAGVEAARALIPPGGVPLDAIVRDVLVAALEQAGWNQSAAARLLRIPRHVLQYRMMKYNIVLPAPRSQP